MNAPHAKAIESPMPQFLKREQPARYGWWSNHTLVIEKGEQRITLDADDLRALSRFVESCGGELA